MRVASPSRASLAAKSPVRRTRKFAEPSKEEFLQQISADLRKTVEALQKLKKNDTPRTRRQYPLQHRQWARRLAAHWWQNLSVQCINGTQVSNSTIFFRNGPIRGRIQYAPNFCLSDWMQITRPISPQWASCHLSLSITQMAKRFGCGMECIIHFYSRLIRSELAEVSIIALLRESALHRPMQTK